MESKEKYKLEHKLFEKFRQTSNNKYIIPNNANTNIIINDKKIRCRINWAANSVLVQIKSTSTQTSIIQVIEQIILARIVYM